MEKITSFTIDHLRLVPGVYVSRKDMADTQTCLLYTSSFLHRLTAETGKIHYRKESGSPVHTDPVSPHILV